VFALKKNHWEPDSAVFHLCAQVTTVRKVFTLLLSYLIFTKPLLGQHCVGLLLISTGIGLKMAPNVFSKTGLSKPREVLPVTAETRGMQKHGNSIKDSVIGTKEEVV
jgi:hypothetical protein